MEAFFQRRQSYFTGQRLLCACIAYAFSGVALLFTIEWLEDAMMEWVILLPPCVMLVFSFIWPSYRISAVGVTAFWAGPLLAFGALAAWHFRIEAIIAVIPYIVLLTAISLLWSLLCTTVFRLRLPRVVPPDECPGCGYSLYSLPHRRCPECGTVSDQPIGA
jgi:ribosomal protein L32